MDAIGLVVITLNLLSGRPIQVRFQLLLRVTVSRSRRLGYDNLGAKTSFSSVCHPTQTPARMVCPIRQLFGGCRACNAE
jgi:hypothetical protein